MSSIIERMGNLSLAIFHARQFNLYTPLMNVLFLCTGNYYRSRFAELLFNHLASRAGLPHRADSRALAIELGADNVGPISPRALAALGAMGVSLPPSHRPPRQASGHDFLAADLVIALKEAEHRPLILQRFPTFAARVRYWHVHDLDAGTPEQAFSDIQANLHRLLASLGAPATAAK